MKATIAAVALLASSAVAAPSKVKRHQHINARACNDVSDNSVAYQGNSWTHLTNQDGSVYQCRSYSYTADPMSSFSFVPPDACQGLTATSFSLWGGKKDDRGLFTVYNVLNYPDQLNQIGGGDMYADTKGVIDSHGVALGTPSVNLFTFNIPAGMDPNFLVTGEAGIDDRIHAHAYYGFDFVEWTCI